MNGKVLPFTMSSATGILPTIRRLSLVWSMWTKSYLLNLCLPMTCACQTLTRSILLRKSNQVDKSILANRHLTVGDVPCKAACCISPNSYSAPAAIAISALPVASITGSHSAASLVATITRIPGRPTKAPIPAACSQISAPALRSPVPFHFASMFQHVSPGSRPPRRDAGIYFPGEPAAVTGEVGLT